VRRVVRGACVILPVAGLIGTIVAATPGPSARFVPGLSFRIAASTRVFPGDTPRGQDDEVMRGRGIAANDRARIEFLAFTPAPQGVTTDDFLIALDSGKTFVEHTSAQRFTTANDMFGGPAVIALGRVMGGGRGNPGGGTPPDGAGGGAARGGARGGRGGPPGGGARGARGRGRGGLGNSFLSQIQLLDVNFKIEKLGAGEAIEGHATQHYRITTDYRVVWGDQGFPAHSVTELWSTQLPTNIPNPFEPLIVADQSTDGPLIEYALKLRGVRAQVEGTPIKVVTTTTLTGIHNVVGFQSYVGNDPTVDKVTIVQQTQITGMTATDVDPKLLVVPDNVGDPGSPEPTGQR
jgi:hypothetical protein